MLKYKLCIQTGMFSHYVAHVLDFSSPEPKAPRWAISKAMTPPSVLCPSTFSNVFSETTGPIEIKFHMETPLDGGTKVCLSGPGPMTKMATTPIYG